MTQTNCKDIYDGGRTTSGQYNITDSTGQMYSVYCDMSLPGGGWTVIQRRVSDAVSFNRNWADYKDGFGDLDADHWLGLDKIHDIVNKPSTTFELYIDMGSFHPRISQSRGFARYRSFSVADETNKYELNIGTLDSSSTAGDSLAYHNRRSFSTPDQDNDSSFAVHCARVYEAGWWFGSCHDSLLNGQYYANGLLANLNVPDGIMWETWVGDRESLKSSLMAVRPV